MTKNYPLLQEMIGRINSLYKLTNKDEKFEVSLTMAPSDRGLPDIRFSTKHALTPKKIEVAWFCDIYSNIHGLLFSYSAVPNESLSEEEAKEFVVDKVLEMLVSGGIANAIRVKEVYKDKF